MTEDSPAEPVVAAVERAFAAWNAGDLETLVAAFDPGCEIHSYLAQTSEPYRGHDGVRLWEREIRESFGRFDVSVHEITAAPKGLLVIAEIQLKGQASGVALTQPAGFVITVQDERIRTLHGFAVHADARKAAGAPE